MANDLMERMSDQTVASFVARSVTVEKGATERLAHALEVLVPEAERKGRILELAHEEARQSEAGQAGRLRAAVAKRRGHAHVVLGCVVRVRGVRQRADGRSRAGARGGARVRRSAGTRARLGRHGLRVRAAGSGSRSAPRSASHRR
jgi:hypothetical protein